MNAGDDRYLKVLINNSDKFLRIDVWTPVTHVHQVGFGI